MKKPIQLLFLSVGWVAFGLGLVGLFLPLLPTTPFLLLAAFCFSKGSPRIHRWLYGLPQVGPILVDWETNGVVRLRSKLIATCLLLPSAVYVCTRPHIPWFGKVSMGILATGVLLFLWTRPSKPSKFTQISTPKNS